MKKAIKWFSGFLSEGGEASSKRLVGVGSAAFLCWTLYSNHNVQHEPSEALVYAVATLSAAALGLTSAEKIFSKKATEEPKAE